MFCYLHSETWLRLPLKGFFLCSDCVVRGAFRPTANASSCSPQQQLLSWHLRCPSQGQGFSCTIAPSTWRTVSYRWKGKSKIYKEVRFVIFFNGVCLLHSLSRSVPVHSERPLRSCVRWNQRLSQRTGWEELRYILIIFHIHNWKVIFLEEEEKGLKNESKVFWRNGNSKVTETKDHSVLFK